MKKDFELINYTQTQIQKPDRNKLYENRVISAFNRGRWLESYKMLRTRTLQLMKSHQWNSLAVTSLSHEAGTSLTSVNLAISMAMELDQTVFLIDANLNNPSIHKMLNLEVTAGLGDYLLHDKPLDELLINPAIDRLVVLPAGEPISNSTEMLRSPKMVKLVDEVINRYPGRIIIFDMPPLLTQADALGFSPYVDSVLLIVDEGKTKMDELKHAASLLQNIEILGTVFNKTMDKKIQFKEI